MTDYLKLGGSLITDKDTPHMARVEIIRRLADEICRAQSDGLDRQLIIGHGSGSFGHIPARQYGTREGVHTPKEWAGFIDVWKQARDLNQIVLDIFIQSGIQAISFPPSAIIQSSNGQPTGIFIDPFVSALKGGLTPIVAGDVVFDSVIGGTIYSTEDVFMALAAKIPPTRVLLCGKDPGVWQDFPACSQIIPAITPESYAAIRSSINGSASVDVTGGMREKVELMLTLVTQYPQAQAVIFSGENPGSLYQNLMGNINGTVISNQ